MLKIQLCISGINYILKFIKMKEKLFEIVIFSRFYCIFDQINADPINIRLQENRKLYHKETPEDSHFYVLRSKRLIKYHINSPFYDKGSLIQFVKYHVVQLSKNINIHEL